MRTELLNSFYPAGDFLERPNVHDIESIGEHVYVATTDGVFAASLGRHHEFSKKLQFRAEALHCWGDRLLCIGKTDFLWYEPKTEQQKPQRITWPRKELLTQHLKENRHGKREVNYEHETPPFFQRARIENGLLYLLYLFSKPNGEHKMPDGTIDVQFGLHDEGILCVYSLPGLSLEQHYTLAYPSYSFALREPFIFYPGGGTENPALHRTDMRTGETVQQPLSDICYAVHCDGTRVFAPQTHLMNVFMVDGFAPTDEVNLPRQMEEYSRGLKDALMQHTGVEREMGYPKYESFCALYKDMDECERDGLWQTLSGNATPYLAVEDCAADEAHGILAVATELGCAPGFLWNTITGKPICWLHDGGRTVVAKRAKLRWPLVMINAYESAHVWNIL